MRQCIRFNATKNMQELMGTGDILKGSFKDYIVLFIMTTLKYYQDKPIFELSIAIIER